VVVKMCKTLLYREIADFDNLIKSRFFKKCPFYKGFREKVLKKIEVKKRIQIQKYNYWTDWHIASRRFLAVKQCVRMLQ